MTFLIWLWSLLAWLGLMIKPALPLIQTVFSFASDAINVVLKGGEAVFKAVKLLDATRLNLKIPLVLVLLAAFIGCGAMALSLFKPDSAADQPVTRVGQMPANGQVAESTSSGKIAAGVEQQSALENAPASEALALNQDGVAEPSPPRTKVYPKATPPSPLIAGSGPSLSPPAIPSGLSGEGEPRVGDDDELTLAAPPMPVPEWANPNHPPFVLIKDDERLIDPEINRIELRKDQWRGGPVRIKLPGDNGVRIYLENEFTKSSTGGVLECDDHLGEVSKKLVFRLLEGNYILIEIDYNSGRHRELVFQRHDGAYRIGGQ